MKSKRILRRFRAEPTPPLPMQVSKPPHLRLVTFNMQWGTPAEGWHQAQPSPSPFHAFWYGLRERIGSTRGSDSINERTTLTEGNLRQSAKILKRHRPDILCLQEVDKGQRRSGYTSQAQFLAHAIGLPYWRIGASYSGQSQVLHRRPLHPTLNSESGYGVAILSRWPVKSWHFKRLGRMRVRLDWGSESWRGFSHGLISGLQDIIPSLRGTRLKFGQMRVIQAARILSPFGVLAIGNIHLEIHRPVALSQLRRAWRSVLDLNHDSCLLVGDYNLRDYHIQRSLQVLPDDMQPQLHAHIASYPANDPKLPLDQLLANGWKLARKPRGLRLPISDHVAVIYDLVPAPSESTAKPETKRGATQRG